MVPHPVFRFKHLTNAEPFGRVGAPSVPRRVRSARHSRRSACLDGEALHRGRRGRAHVVLSLEGHQAGSRLPHQQHRQLAEGVKSCLRRGVFGENREAMPHKLRVRSTAGMDVRPRGAF